MQKRIGQRELRQTLKAILSAKDAGHLAHFRWELVRDVVERSEYESEDRSDLSRAINLLREASQYLSIEAEKNEREEAKVVLSSVSIEMKAFAKRVAERIYEEEQASYFDELV